MSEPFDTEFEYETAIGPGAGVSRRDPSDVIAVDGVYYVWYTKINEDDPYYPHGYAGTVWYATSPDGHEWTEQRQAIAGGGDGDWNEHGAFTPNVLVADGRYYLFYVGVPDPFENDYPDATST